jgi:hypothetical protein
MSVTFNKTISYGNPQLISFSSTDNLATVQTLNYMQDVCSSYPFVAGDIVIIQYMNDDSSLSTGFFSASFDVNGNVTVTQVVKF